MIGASILGKGRQSLQGGARAGFSGTGSEAGAIVAEHHSQLDDEGGSFRCDSRADANQDGGVSSKNESLTQENNDINKSILKNY